MAQERRTKVSSSAGQMSTGIMTARVVSYIDPKFMGGLEVTLLRDQGNTVGANQQTYSVKYATPFYGVTGYEHMGLNKADFADTQKSYGMWFPTPEIGTTVLVAFVDGNPSQGYFIGCVPGRFMNHMVPSIGASSNVELTDEDRKKYDTDQPLPVGEVNRKANTLDKSLEIDKIKKPVHPIADRFLEQGLLEDDVRGPAQTTSRRNLPNSVFGISTPGPVDRTGTGKREFVGKKETRTTSTVPVSRTGGTQFVMDDGDERFVRATSASFGPVEYIDTLDPQQTTQRNSDIPYNEHVRLRTRTGHQILLHNSEDLIYIGNAKGTAWIELTSNGKIDIYAQDSISVHTEADFNFRADRDINIEAGRNINMRTAGGRLHADVNGNLEFAVSGDSLLTTLADLQVRTTGNSRLSSGSGLDISTVGTNKISSTEALDLAVGGAFIAEATGTASIKGSDVIMQGGEIHLNGPAGLAAGSAEEAESVQTLSLFENPTTSSLEKWNGGNRYQIPENIRSIMRRVPMHEPWIFHENFSPQIFSREFTDRDRFAESLPDENAEATDTPITSAADGLPESAPAPGQYDGEGGVADGVDDLPEEELDLEGGVADGVEDLPEEDLLDNSAAIAAIDNEISQLRNESRQVGAEWEQLKSLDSELDTDFTRRATEIRRLDRSGVTVEPSRLAALDRINRTREENANRANEIRAIITKNNARISKLLADKSTLQSR